MKYIYNGRGPDDIGLQRKLAVIQSKKDDISRAFALIKNTKGDMSFGNMKQLQAKAESVLEDYMRECAKHLLNIQKEVDRKGGDVAFDLFSLTKRK